MSCVWPHHVTTLFGVDPCPVSELPQVCTCGQPITYAVEVTFFAWSGVDMGPTSSDPPTGVPTSMVVCPDEGVEQALKKS